MLRLSNEQAGQRLRWKTIPKVIEGIPEAENTELNVDALLDEVEDVASCERQDLLDLRDLFDGQYERCKGCGHLTSRIYVCKCGYIEDEY